jgi:hypothetical protein
MSCACILFNCSGSKRLSPLVASFLALVLIPPVLHAQNQDQGNGNDPTGAWLVTDTSAGSDGQPSVIATFHKDGTTAGDVRGDVTGTGVPDAVFSSPEHGVWKKTGARTFTANFVGSCYNRDNSLFAIVEVDGNFRLDQPGDQYDAQYVVSETLPNGQVSNLGSGTSHGVRITLKPPAF